MKFQVRVAALIATILIASVFAFAQKITVTTSTDAMPNNHIKVKYNKSKNETTVTLKTLSLSNSMNKEFTRESEFGQLDLDAYFTYPGQQLTKPAESMTLAFKATQKNQLWQRAQNLVAVIDDQTALVLGATSYSSNSQTFYFEELMKISVPYEAIRKIAAAKSLAFQLGTRNIRIKEDQLEDLRAIAARMTP
jgi:hypothetical protein